MNDQPARDLHRSTTMDRMARAGLIAYGLVHLMVGWVAIKLALGNHSGSTNTKGALQDLSSKPFGQTLVWAVAVGLFFLVIWKLLEAAVGHHEEEARTRWRTRVTCVAKAVIYGVLGGSAVKVVTGSSDTGDGTDSMTAKLMNLPGGQVIVVAIGLGILAYGGATAWRGWSEKFAKHLDSDGRTGTDGALYLILGRVGYIAKGLSLSMVGVFFVVAGVQHEPKESGGLDQALHKVLEQPFGPYLLGLMAVGIACYGAFCFAQARHLRR